MTFSSLDGVLLAIAFLLPGFVWDCVLQMFLFLQRVYRVEDDGPWQPVPMSRGVWIHGQAIRTIEFLAFR